MILTLNFLKAYPYGFRGLTGLRENLREVVSTPTALRGLRSTERRVERLGAKHLGYDVVEQRWKQKYVLVMPQTLENDWLRQMKLPSKPNNVRLVKWLLQIKPEAAMYDPANHRTEAPKRVWLLATSVYLRACQTVLNCCLIMLLSSIPRCITTQTLLSFVFRVHQFDFTTLSAFQKHVPQHLI